jgi:peptidylprolyl isomerase
MKLSRTLLLFGAAPALLALLSVVAPCAVAQTATPAKPAVHHATTAAPHPGAAKAGCATVPPISPKIPALPAGAPCARILYTITTVPGAKLENVSPMEGPALREELGLEPTSFSLDYIDIKVGTGELAQPHKWYTVHYSGYLVDGTKFDSSYDHPPDHAPMTLQIGAPAVIPGWDTGFAGMRIGGKRRLYIPYELGYGVSAYPPNRPTVIPAKSELIFDIEFLAQSDKAPPPPPAPPTPAPAPPTPSSATPPAPGAAPAATQTPSATPPAAKAPPAATPVPPPTPPPGASTPPRPQ